MRALAVWRVALGIACYWQRGADPAAREDARKSAQRKSRVHRTKAAKGRESAARTESEASAASLSFSDPLPQAPSAEHPADTTGNLEANVASLTIRCT